MVEHEAKIQLSNMGIDLATPTLSNRGIGAYSEALSYLLEAFGGLCGQRGLDLREQERRAALLLCISFK